MKVFNLEEQVVLLEKYKINSDELLFITIILLIQEGDNSPYIQLYFSLPISCRGSIRDLLISLQEKQVITKEYKIPPAGTQFIPEDVSFNKNFKANVTNYAGPVAFIITDKHERRKTDIVKLNPANTLKLDEEHSEIIDFNRLDEQDDNSEETMTLDF